jgi:hypothetical protein
MKKFYDEADIPFLISYFLNCCFPLNLEHYDDCLVCWHFFILNNYNIIPK